MNSKELIVKYRSKDYDLCCSESIFYAANEYYNLEFSNDTLKIAAAFCGGNLTEDNCGLYTASISIIAVMFTEGVSHQSPLLKQYVSEFKTEFNEKYLSFNCKRLKELYRDEVFGCNDFIIDCFQLLCKFIDDRL